MRGLSLTLLVGLASVAALGAERPDWAFPVSDKAQPPTKQDDQLKTVTGSSRSYTQAQIDDLKNPPDWIPDMHPPMPAVVAQGMNTFACGSCHLPIGAGHDESAYLAGLPVPYIVQQMTDFKTGARKGFGDMPDIAQSPSDADIQSAAAYFASLTARPWIRVVETETVPKTYVNPNNMRLALPDGGTEPIGSRVVELPENAEAAVERDPRSGFVAYALECAMDELSYALDIDPIELRRRNEPQIDEGENKPFSSRSLMKCYDLGAERFGWSRRASRPRSMRDGRLLVGMGVASATYPAVQSPASALVRLLPNGTAEVKVAASDMGPGTYTSMTQVAADALCLGVEQIRFSLGRSDFPPAPPHGGSQTMASVGSAVRAACVAVLEETAKRAVKDQRSVVFGAPLDAVEWNEGRLRRRDDTSPGQPLSEIVKSAQQPIEAIASTHRDPDMATRYSMSAFGAVFAEVAVDPEVATITVRRAFGAYGIGRVVNPRLAMSQCIGGMVGGIGMALMDRTVLDCRDGRPVNAHMADYLVPVNLDIQQIEAKFVEEDDQRVNSLGVKGLGEIALIGMAPAIANAVFHATGTRVRDLPIKIENLL